MKSPIPKADNVIEESLLVKSGSRTAVLHLSDDQTCVRPSVSGCELEAITASAVTGVTSCYATHEAQATSVIVSSDDILITQPAPKPKHFHSPGQ